ncbi:MAG: hypothetical protein GX606_04415 [Elusimicrobia bacterium]|nr:hypothetical protein [Elusimicrobiota bacterium]
MVRKYWLIILLLGVVYALFEGASGTLTNLSGKPQISLLEIGKLYRDPGQRDRLFQALRDSGYIDENGRVQPKLQDAVAPRSLELSLEFQADRFEIYEFLNQYRYRLPFPRAVYYLLAFLFWAAGLLMSVGFTKVHLMLMRDQEPEVSELFTNGNLVVPYLLGSLCYGLAVLGGFILLIVPGIILSIMLGLYAYLIVDKGLGPLAALRRSRVITRGQRWRLANFWGMLLLLNLAGLLCLLVGAIVTGWISVIASAYVYEKLENAPDVQPQALAA